jgi:hypothetical protein
LDLVDLIEKRRFVGQEFLVFLWFESELFEGRFDVPGFGPAELWLEGQITLTQDKEQSKLKGSAPSAAPEAHEALRQGKLPTQARVRISRGELEYAFLFTADKFALSAVKLPSLVKEETDEQFYERMYLLEELESLLGALYGEFLALRLSTLWETDAMPAIRAWVRGEPIADPAAYRKARARAVPLGHHKQRMTTPPPAAKPEIPALAESAVA